MAQLTTIIVHGTFAQSQDWWQDTGAPNFWSYIKGITSTLYGGVGSYSWSGANHHSDRVLAAQDLMQWCSGHGVGRLQAIAHSHGANVCLIASQLGLRFENLIALGNPIRFDYAPDMRNVDSLFNLYSEYDHVQTPFGTFGACRGEGRTLADTRILINHHVPHFSPGNTAAGVGHADLHETSVWQGNGLDRLVVVQ